MIQLTFSPVTLTLKDQHVLIELQEILIVVMTSQCMYYQQKKIWESDWVEGKPIKIYLNYITFTAMVIGMENWCYQDVHGLIYLEEAYAYIKYRYCGMNKICPILTKKDIDYT